MKSYLGLWLLLAAALAVVIVVSAFSPVKIGEYELRDSGAYAALTAPRSETAADAIASGEASEVGATEDEVPTMHEPAPVDTLPKTLLFVGDSMLEGLYPRLAAYADKNGHTLYAVIWYSSTSEVWGRSDKLKKYIEQLSPDYVFICLGANELFVRDIAAKRDGYVKEILSQVGSLPYLWIGPPNWKPDTGINRLVESNTAPGCFFLSDGMTFRRSKDGAHPTRESAVEWMDSVVRWMPAHHPHPIRLDLPDKNTSRARRVFVHQPSER
ncbi:MAG: hypothetical protein K2M19_07300 [Muribaculaceae bacterium]|nr:hypothetical protein [Muribaculaceae bacterium]